uniref:Uncharacterized protein n=1 Tax=Rhizophora mucronata TaxID=61149 RepID=A0A2P2L0F8_RHIMU
MVSLPWCVHSDLLFMLDLLVYWSVIKILFIHFLLVLLYCFLLREVQELSSIFNREIFEVYPGDPFVWFTDCCIDACL